MTDYSAQGKTREWNVVDITNCRTFHGAYTCLSRGTTLQQTLILRDFPDTLLCGTLDGALRQEYRELEYLTVITDLIYEGILPCGILKTARWDTIAAYRAWKATIGATVHVAPAFAVDDDMAPPTNLAGVAHETLRSSEKRKATVGIPAPPPQKRRRGQGHSVLANAAWASPVGPVWDSQDWSCAYDALTFVLHSLWVSDRVKWSRILKTFSETLRCMVAGFEEMRGLDPEREVTDVRDMWRNVLRIDRSAAYPTGRQGADIMSLANDVLGYQFHGSRVEFVCDNCGYGDYRSAQFPATLGAFCSVRGANSIQDFVSMCLRVVVSCPACTGDMPVAHRFSEVLCMEIVEAGALDLDDRIHVEGWGLYRLAGVVYFGDDHFISRSLTSDNKVYQQDGMEGGYSTYDGVLGESLSSSDLGTCHGKNASLAIYAFADRVRLRD